MNDNAVRCILYEGLTGGSLIMILNAWVGGEDAEYWNRKGAYVPELIPAALSLLRDGMIEVWQEPLPLGVGEGSLVTIDRAAEALSDPGNWWRYDPDDQSDSAPRVESADDPDHDRGPMRSMYSIITTAAARDRGVAIWCGTDDAPTPHSAEQ
jgi:hypothetical protein